jgi:3-methyladenine DNA glycosylase/8-oxoguanine DNA glycosylase
VLGLNAVPSSLASRHGAAGVGATLPGPMPSRLLPTPESIDITLTLAPLRRGPGDPTMRIGREVWRTTRTPDGPATIRIARTDGGVEVEAWGPGADDVLRRGPALVGLEDDPSAFQPTDPLLRRLHLLRRGLRMARSGAVMEALVPAILEQKVTGTEAYRAFRALVLRYGEPAPGPAGDAGMRVAPAPSVLAGLPYFAYHPLGVERRRAEVIRRVCGSAAAIEAAAALGSGPLTTRLRTFPGIGAWTAAEVAVRTLGDPDAVSVGDFHLPNLVAWALAHEPRGTDERMLELLEPYRGQRARAVRLLELSGIRAPRFGPRMAPRSIAAI